AKIEESIRLISGLRSGAYTTFWQRKSYQPSTYSGLNLNQYGVASP
ncbi:TPA: hypothetical protein WH558_001937, partial [Neisseria meningitidis]